jgi:hypothetical protein
MGSEGGGSYLISLPHLEDIPKEWKEWHPSIRKARLLSESLFSSWTDALLFRTLATLRLDVPVLDTVEDLRWKGPRPSPQQVQGGRTCSQSEKKLEHENDSG